MSGQASPTLYFAYGSNLSLKQMRDRCPGSTYFGFGALRGYTWIINERGYANVVKTSRDPAKGIGAGRGPEEGKREDVVEGMLYRLTAEDEKRLDAAEGVPFIYEKHVLGIEICCLEGGEGRGEGQAEMSVDALVYVDVERVEDGDIKEEYVARMNRGIRDAKNKGMTDRYIDDVLRKWIPAGDNVDGKEDQVEVRDPFLWQARGDDRE